MTTATPTMPVVTPIVAPVVTPISRVAHIKSVIDNIVNINNQFKKTPEAGKKHKFYKKRDTDSTGNELIIRLIKQATKQANNDKIMDPFDTA
jgi:hypothetical protein